MSCLVDLGLRINYFNSCSLCLEELALVCPLDMPLVRVGAVAGCSPAPKPSETPSRSEQRALLPCLWVFLHSQCIVSLSLRLQENSTSRAHPEDRDCRRLALNRAKVWKEAWWDVVHLTCRRVHLALQGSAEGWVGRCPSIQPVGERLILREVSPCCPLAAVRAAGLEWWEL